MFNLGHLKFLPSVELQKEKNTGETSSAENRVCASTDAFNYWGAAAAFPFAADVERRR
jgi:hypothetical protein